MIILSLLVLKNKSDEAIKIDTGLTRDQFCNLFQSLPSLRAELQNNIIASDFLYTYLMKIRTGRTHEDIARIFGITAMAVSKRLNRVRVAMEQDFVYRYVNCLLSREELAERTTMFSQMLFCNGDTSRPVLILDGTYVYIQKSTNFEMQKQSYSDQKKRNFVRVMKCVTTDGTIIFALGPYPASSNDAKILPSIVENSNAFNNLIAGDVLLVDRGFQRCVTFLEDRGFNVQMPAFLERSQSQLTTLEANKSRFVTANRYGVETRNGHVKTIFKIFQKEWCNTALPHMMTDYRVCAALINAYFKSIESNKGIATEIATQMLHRLETPNRISTIIFTNDFQKKLIQFDQFSDFEELPKLTEMDLIWISLGKYQIKQAASYCQLHMRANQMEFIVYACPNDICERYFSDFFCDNRQPKLLMIRIKYRFRTNKTRDAYILIDAVGEGHTSVLAYCCDCYNGLRTVGCCSHVMCLIWFTLHIKTPFNMHGPAAFLNDYFNEALLSASDFDSDDE